MKHRIILTAKLALVLAMALVVYNAREFPDWMTGRPCPTVRLLAAIGTRDLPEFEAALADGASLSDHAEDDPLPLFNAASVGQFEMTRRLIDLGAEVNAADSNGGTALMAAAAEDHVAIVELLLRSGANLACRDLQHRTALDRADERECVGTAQVLRRAAATTRCSELARR